MITYDDSSLNVEKRGKLPLYEGLEDFAMRVSMAKPMINFVVNSKCIGNKYIKKDDTHIEYINGFVIFENGEELGAIGTDRRYRGHSDAELVYEVESFRIDKERGAKNSTQSKDIKVALRLAKKMLVARADDEAIQLIHETVKTTIYNLYNEAWNEVKWSITSNDEAFFYSRMAYLARLRGEDYVSLPTKLVSVSNPVEHDNACAKSEDAFFIKNLFLAKKGYGIQALANGNLYVYSFADKSIKRYNDFYSLPENIQGKYAMFKVLKVNEIVTTIGIKIKDEFAYVVE